MSAPIILPPDTIEQEVKVLPANHNPFGVNCDIDRNIQSILFHYGIDPEVVNVIEKTGYVAKKFFKRADPDGSDRERALFKKSIADKIENPLMEDLVEDAVRRILSPNPLAAIIPVTTATRSSDASKPKKPKGSPLDVASSSSGASTSASAPAIASTSGTAAPAAKPNKRKKNNDTDDSDDSDDGLEPISDDDLNDDANGASSSASATRGSRSKDLSTLFDDAKNEVFHKNFHNT